MQITCKNEEHFMRSVPGTASLPSFTLQWQFVGVNMPKLSTIATNPTCQELSCKGAGVISRLTGGIVSVLSTRVAEA